MTAEEVQAHVDDSVGTEFNSVAPKVRVEAEQVRLAAERGVQIVRGHRPHTPDLQLPLTLEARP